MHAAADESHARKLYIQGSTAFTAGHFAEAAKLFEQAYAESKLAKLIWNIAQAYRRQYDVDHDLATLRRARVLMRNYVDIAPTMQERNEAKAAEEQAEAEIRTVEQRAAEERAEKNEKQSMKPERTTIVVAAQPERPSRVPGFVLLGAGAGLALAGMGFGLAAKAEADTVQSSQSAGAPIQFSTVSQHETRGQIYEILSYTFYGIAAAAAATGAVLLIVRSGSKKQRAYLAPAAGGASWEVCFEDGPHIGRLAREQLLQSGPT